MKKKFHFIENEKINLNSKHKYIIFGKGYNDN